MPAMKGRSVLIKRNGAVLAGCRTKSITVNGSPIDVTTDDDDGVRRLLDQPGQVDVEISVSGIVLGETLRSESLSTSDRVSNTTFQFGGFEGSPGNTFGYSGEFFMASYSEGAPYQEAITFEATFQSASLITYTPK